MQETIRERLKGIIAEEIDCDPNDINDDTNLANDLDADSLDVIQIAGMIEEEFGITLPDDVELPATFSEIVSFIEGKVQ